MKTLSKIFAALTWISIMAAMTFTTLACISGADDQWARLAFAYFVISAFFLGLALVADNACDQ